LKLEKTESGQIDLCKQPPTQYHAKDHDPIFKFTTWSPI
jgi:hypothetical protein